MPFTERVLRLDKLSLDEEATQALLPDTVRLLKALLYFTAGNKLTPLYLVRKLDEATDSLKVSPSDADFDWHIRPAVIETIRLLDDFCPDFAYMACLHRFCREKLHLDPPLKDPFTLATTLRLDVRTLREADLDAYPPAATWLRDWLVGKICLGSLNLPLSCNQRVIRNDLEHIGYLIKYGWSGSFVGFSPATNALARDLTFSIDEYGLRYSFIADSESPIEIYVAPQA